MVSGCEGGPGRTTRLTHEAPPGAAVSHLRRHGRDRQGESERREKGRVYEGCNIANVTAPSCHQLNPISPIEAGNPGLAVQPKRRLAVRARWQQPPAAVGLSAEHSASQQGANRLPAAIPGWNRRHAVCRIVCQQTNQGHDVRGLPSTHIGGKLCLCGAIERPVVRGAGRMAVGGQRGTRAMKGAFDPGLVNYPK